MVTKIKLVVLNEHTLGYILPQLPKYVQVLHASILKGAPFELHPSSKYIFQSDVVRLASKTDFDSFKVSMVGFNSEEYEFKM
jgi:hypothetical protein